MKKSMAVGVLILTIMATATATPSNDPPEKDWADWVQNYQDKGKDIQELLERIESWEKNGVLEMSKKEIAAIEKLATEGNASAQYMLARWYLEYDPLSFRRQRNIVSSYEKGMRWLNTSADKGFERARQTIGEFYIFEETILANHCFPQDNIIAYAILKEIKADSPNNQWAKAYASSVFYALNPSEIKVSENLSREIAKPGNFTKALDGYLKKMRLSKICPKPETSPMPPLTLETHGDAALYEKQFKAYSRLAKKWVVYAQYNLAEMYRNGWGTSQNIPEAIKWYRLTANAWTGRIGGSEEAALTTLAEMYMTGEGVAKNRVVAFALYDFVANAVFAQTQQADVRNAEDHIATISRTALSLTLSGDELGIGRALSQSLSDPGKNPWEPSNSILKSLDAYFKRNK